MIESVEELLARFATVSQRGALIRYYEMLMEWNERMNLTAIVGRDDVFIKHFWDSLSVLDIDIFTDPEEPIRRIIDVGTGAGLPGLPLAICRPDISVTLCDSLNKRTKFLEAVRDELHLNNIEIFHARSEEFARQKPHRNQYDIVLARAVAKLNVLSELLVPFARPGGHVVAYKGPDVGNEITDARHALNELNARVVSSEAVALPREMGSRTLIVIQVDKLTAAKYPRRAGVPQKQPL
ncbi:16S rRNA (guanine(527)-N(7))-methyltransferase RsmG [Alicyclobacillus sp. SO9]|uniref:16S rRNA (guanine(527)-N(7))-methyltransferase RsmG n=1 Tax=Alicyclobacillus sp. SO9 TaxID=2665646 RepID=UPI0018E89BF0|nr:16S rRNA (guanine(527)-N(7))-methyltransferase RsmG [Alicyclobacillus sp. SO9]QQE78948.1 16S rRNA (guanine(527)-N(7))-methyltransferase RsmG [Alicyclobacillus sp. SO9]